MLSLVPAFSRYSVLWLVIGLKISSAVRCLSCYDDPNNGAAHDTADCPWNTGVANNVAALATAGTALAVSTLLPLRILRVFPKTVLHTLKSLIDYPVSTSGQMTLTDATTAQQMVRGIQSGAVLKEDCILHLIGRMEALDSSRPTYSAQFKVIEATISSLKDIKPRVGTSSSSEGCHLYILARLSAIVCRKEGSFDLCVECADDGEMGSSTTPPSVITTYTAKLVRPQSLAQVGALLNLFVLVEVSLGLTSPLGMLPFIDDVIWEPVRLGALEWPVAFEMFLAYLRMVQQEPSRWSISTVVASSGAMDKKEKEARSLAVGLYPAGSFRAPGGKPGHVTPEPDLNGRGGKSDLYVGDVTPSTTAKSGCAAWNLDKPHLKKHVGPGGVCKFLHMCDQYVTDKGPGGQCLQGHKRTVCTYPKEKKCNSPVRA